MRNKWHTFCGHGVVTYINYSGTYRGTWFVRLVFISRNQLLCDRDRLLTQRRDRILFYWCFS